jgi:DNA-binding NarL/FixJ family response regulator
MIRVLLADDHGIVRDALRYLLQAQADIEVIAEAVDGQDAIDEVHLVCPDVAVLDLSMPRINGIEAAKQILASCPNTRVIMLTIYHSQQHIDRAVQAGACGYILKDSAGQELATAIRMVYRGGTYFGSSIRGGGMPN